MKTFSRINLGYILAGGVIARSIIDPSLFVISTKFSDSITALTMLTSLVSGLLIVLSLHRGVNFILLTIYRYIKRDPNWDDRIKTSQKDDFSTILNDIYGNIIITIILVLSFLSYWTSSPFLSSFKVPLISPIVDMTPIFGITAWYYVNNYYQNYSQREEET